MNTKFTVKNFRSFDEEGATFEIAPITLLTGCNSSGKSSLVKSMVLLSKFIQQMKDNYQKNGECWPQNYPLSVTDVKLQLGNYKSILNRDAENDGKVTLAYSIKPLQSDMEFIVSYAFAASDADNFNEGWLREIKIETNSAELILHAIIDENKEVAVKEYNLFPLKNGFINFSLYEVLASLNHYYENYEMIGEESGIKESQVDGLKKEIKELRDLLKTRLTKDERENYKLWELRKHYPNRQKYKLSGNDQGLIRLVDGFNSLFPLPVFIKLQGVSKEKTRETIWKYYKVNDDEVKENIDIILDDFEKSEYNALLDYFVAKENAEGLIGRDSHYEFFFHPKNVFESIITSIEGLKVFPWFNVDRDVVYAEPLREISFDGEVNEEEAIDKIAETKKMREERKRQYEEKLRVDREMLPFSFVYDNLLRYSVLINKSFAKYFPNTGFATDLNGYEHPVLRFFKNYFYDLLFSIMLPEENIGNFKYVSSSRVAIQRLYTFDTHDDFSKLLNVYYKAKQSYVGEYIPDTFLNTWVQKFGIGHHISIKNTEEGLGIVVRLHDSEKDEKGHLLADEGYGISQLMSVLLEIETNILSVKTMDGFKADDGKLVFDQFRNFDNKTKIPAILTIAIEEPEIHLHPKYQSLLADMFLEAYREHNIHFIVETHSEYLIRKFQTFVGKHNNEPDEGIGEDELSLYYLYSPKDEKRPEGEPQVKKIDFNKDGRLTSPFGPGFFDVADDLSYQLLTMKIGG